MFVSGVLTYWSVWLDRKVALTLDVSQSIVVNDCSPLADSWSPFRLNLINAWLFTNAFANAATTCSSRLLCEIIKTAKLELGHSNTLQDSSTPWL